MREAADRASRRERREGGRNPERIRLGAWWRGDDYPWWRDEPRPEPSGGAATTRAPRDRRLKKKRRSS